MEPHDQTDFSYDYVENLAYNKALCVAKETSEKLKQSFYAMSEKLYAQANQNAGANPGAGAEGPKADENGNVYNADYKVEDDKKDDNK